MRNIISAVLLLTLVVSFAVQRNYRFPHTNLVPDTLLVVLAVLSVFLLITGIRQKVGVVEDEEEPLPWLDLLRATGLLLAWILSLPYLGFALGSIVFFIIITVTMRTSRPTLRQLLLDVAVGVVLVLAIQWLFTEVLYVRLPRGGF